MLLSITQWLLHLRKSITNTLMLYTLHISLAHSGTRESRKLLFMLDRQIGFKFYIEVKFY